MPVPRYERELDEAGGPRFSRLFLVALATAIFLGLAVGAAWTVAGLLHFHGL